MNFSPFVEGHWVDLPWRRDAVCIDSDPALFFPSRGESTMEARRLCAVCPVREECLAYALKHEQHGFWGGMGEGERESLKRRQRRARADGRTA